MKFAVIDDSESILSLIESILHTFFKGCEVSKFLSSEDFFENSSPIYFDFIITDFQLPGISGKELAKLIRATNSKIPILMITGNGNNELIRELFVNKLIDDYIDKPISAKIMIDRITTIMTNAKSSKDSYFWIKDNTSFNKVKIPYTELNFIKTTDKNKVLEINTESTVLFARGSMTELVEMFDLNFIKGRQYIINKSNIKEINFSENLLMFHSGASIEIPRRKLTEFEKIVN